jgi:hypothetical protein
MLSLYPVMLNAFFVPGTHWEERLEMALLHVVFAACLCFTSGLLYSWHTGTQSAEPLLATLPVRFFFWAMLGMALLFFVSWWLGAYYVPLLRHDCCRRP